MQLSPNKSSQPPPQKVKNILIRHSCSKEVRLNSSFQSPEKFHLLKYSPKYYNTLSLEVTKENPLQSKIKKIKKLQTFTEHFKSDLKRSLFRTLLGNNRKLIKEMPQIPCEHLWSWRKNVDRRFALWKIKLFPNITRLVLPKRRDDYKMKDPDDFLAIRKSSMRDLRNMKGLRHWTSFWKTRIIKR